MLRANPPLKAHRSCAPRLFSAFTMPRKSSFTERCASLPSAAHSTSTSPYSFIHSTGCSYWHSTSHCSTSSSLACHINEQVNIHNGVHHFLCRRQFMVQLTTRLSNTRKMALKITIKAAGPRSTSNSSQHSAPALGQGVRSRKKDATHLYMCTRLQRLSSSWSASRP